MVSHSVATILESDLTFSSQAFLEDRPQWVERPLLALDNMRVASRAVEEEVEAEREEGAGCEADEEGLQALAGGVGGEEGGVISRFVQYQGVSLYCHSQFTAFSRNLVLSSSESTSDLSRPHTPKIDA